MVSRLRRAIGQELDGGLIVEQDPSTLRVYPGFEIAALAEMKSVEERPPIEGDRIGPLSPANRVVEFPDIGADELRIQSDLLSGRDDDVAAECAPDGVDRLVERVSRARGGAFRP